MATKAKPKSAETTLDEHAAKRNGSMEEQMQRAAEDAGWSEASPDFAEVWDFEEDGATLEGIYVNKTIVDTDDLRNPGQTRKSNLYEISLTGSTDSDDLRAVWGTASLDQKFEEIQKGERVQITYKGMEDFTGENNEPRRIRRFRVLHKSA